MCSTYILPLQLDVYVLDFILVLDIEDIWHYIIELTSEVLKWTLVIITIVFKLLLIFLVHMKVKFFVDICHCILLTFVPLKVCFLLVYL